MIRDLLDAKNFSITVGFSDLKILVKEIIEDTKKEFGDLVTVQKSETYISRQRASEMLGVDLSTLWRWAQRNYLVPVNVGGQRRYKMSDLNRLLNN